MIIFPAIDIKDGKVVRLLQGKFDKVTEYAKDPVAMAIHWQNEGAQWLHIVDLDGALEGTMKNMDTILSIAKAINIPIQVGGGIRSKNDIHKLIEGGVKRIILGTKAIEDKDFLKEILFEFRDTVAISVDCNNGMVAQRGWTKTSQVKATDFIKELESLGVSCIIFTDIARDGMLTGPNFESLNQILEITNIPVIASGGVSSLNDIKKLSELKDKGVMGIITGKAIYEGKINLKEALNLC